MTARETHLAQMLGDAQNVDRPARIQRLRGVDAEWTAEQGSFKAGDYRMGSGVTIYAALCAMRGEAAITDAPPAPPQTVQSMAAAILRLQSAVHDLEADRGSDGQTTVSRLDDLDQRLMALRDRLATVEADQALANGHGGSKMHLDAGFNAGVATERERCAKLAHEFGAIRSSTACLDLSEAIRDPNREPKP